MTETAGSGRYRLVEWPADRKAIDIGDFFSDSSRIKTVLGWEARTGLPDGLTRTFAYYRSCLEQYTAPAGQQAASS